MPIDLTGITPSAEKAAELFPPTLIGPTWQKNPDGSWLLPEHTLGWDLLGWVSIKLTDPDGEPFQCTAEQARFLLWYYAIDKRGKFIYRQAVLQRLKGWGKDPLAAVMCMIELIGPSRFSHWVDAEGFKTSRWEPGCRPVGKAHASAFVIVTAVSLDQTENTTLLFPSLIPDRTREEYRIDVQKEVIYANGGRQKLKAVAASYRASEGQRVSWALLNETHHWVPGKGADKFYRTVKNNVTKVKGRFICITNAYEPGEESVAQIIREEQEKVWAGLAKPSGWLYDSIEAHPEAVLDGEDGWLPYILETIRGDAYWLDIEIIVQSMMDTSIPTATHRRMWLNQIVSTADSLVTTGEWDAIRVNSLTGTKADLNKGDTVVLGFDGGKTDDATALVAIRLSDKLIVPLAIWQKPEGKKDWHINEAEVETEVHQAMATYKVLAFYADVYPWESFINGWSDIYREQLLVKASSKSTIGFDMRGNAERIARGNEALLAMVQGKRIFHNGDKALRVHVLNTKRRRNQFGLIFGKDHAESPRKVDGWAATLLAFIAMTDLAESGKKAKPVYNRRLIQF
jgi:hypothetical protein